MTWRRAPLDNVFGLLPGWWRFSDSDLRQRSALLSRDRWIDLLGQCGFREATSFISSPKAEEDQQACFIARAPDPVELPSDAEDEEFGPAAAVKAGGKEETEPAAAYLVIKDGAGVCDRLVASLSERGCEVVETDDSVESLAAALDALDAEGRAPAGVVHGLSLDHPRAESIDLEALDAAQDKGVRSAHRLFTLLAGREWKHGRPGVWFLTRGTTPVGPDDRISGLASAPLTGFLRVANNEKPEFGWHQIDLDPASGEFEIADLTDELLLADGEHEVAFRGAHRHVRRVHRVKSEELPPLTRNAIQPDGSALPYRLQIDKPGILTNLSLNETARREPGPDEIEVRVKAGGINFRDVMKALGMYPGNPVDLKWFGDDFSGEVVRVGSSVDDLKPGDSVVGMAPYCFRGHVTVHRRLVFRKAESMTHVEAATLPTVFLTAHYAINELARMRRGESILVHAGTGGVGQAAIQIAKHLGLTVFSTAGSPEKRRLLHDMGVDHVLDSRTLEFADRIMEITEGRGVDAVLNSLAGDFIPKNFSVLSTFGRYLEIGKVDIYGNSKIGLEPLRNNISFFVIDLAQHLESKPEYIAEMFSELENRFQAGDYRPLPNKVFPVTRVVDAFRYMAAGKHIGKNVLDFDVPEIPIGHATEDGHVFQAAGSWLITGGAGGFGLELALWMAENGARHFALMSRSGPKEDALPKIDALKAMGCTVVDARGDVTSRADVDRIVAEIQASGHPLTGVIHGAMVLDDEFIVELDRERFDRVLLPKMLGAWNLHAATLGIPLEHFICFSSYSAVIGAVKQANYNAGNVFLDQLAYYRRGLGLPALTFNWGALKGAGFVERNEKTQQYLEMVGLGATDMDETLALFRRGLPTAATQIGAARVDWQALARFSPSVGGSNMFLPVVPRSGDGSGGDSMAARILEAPADKRMAMVEDLIAAQVGAVLGTEASRIDKDTPLTNLGLDSLMAIELVNRIEEKLGMSMPMGSVLNGPNIRDLSIPVLEKLLENAGDYTGGGEAAAEFVPFEATGEMPEVFPLTEGQRALWFLHRLAPNSSAYNLIFSGKFRPMLDIEAMKKAFALLFERHPMFDVTFTTRDGEPVQILQKGRTIDFREHDCSTLNDEQLRALISDHANRPFDLERGPVVRLELFRTADHAHVALLSMHHIISDAWSVAVLMQDLIEYYFSVKSGRTPKIESLPASYADFVRWEKAHLDSPTGESMFEYWKNQLAGAPVALDLPADRPRPAVQTFNGATLGFQLDEELTGKIGELAKSHNATLFTTLLSGYEILLHRYCQQDDLVVGVPLAGRNQPELKGVVGYFINPVPLRSTIEDDPTVAAYLERNRDIVNGALENQQFPLVKMVDRLRVPRDPGRSPVFQVTFSMERIPGVDEQGIAVFLIGQGGHTFHVGDLSMETIDLTTRQAQFEITLVVEEAGGHLFGCWQYNRDLFDASTIAELNALYERVLRGMVANHEARVSEIDLLSDTERERVLDGFNRTAVEFPREKTLHQVFDESAAAHADRTALVFGESEIGYGELKRQANGIARRLVAEGVRPGDNVGVLINRSAEMVASLLGALKAGATYVPLDPEFPEQRLTEMLRDAAPRVLLTSRELVDELPDGDWKVVAVEGIEPAADAPEVSGLTPESLAYIIYTSGSTGTPKGVEIPHRAAVNFLTSMLREPGMTAEDRLLAVTTLSFDISLLEMFLPLLAGATVVIASREDVKDGRRLSNLIRDEEITVMQATPATWRLLLDSGWEGANGLRIFCGGEALNRDLANVLVNSASEVWNLYGPTETTVWSTAQRVEEGDGVVTIGRPIANTRIYLLDSHRRPVPAGFTGELWIGGDGLARGYRNRPELTAEAFADVALPDGETPRLYRTGDLARWTRDGVLECLGRVDFQVKVRGVRIELGDIEAQLVSHPAIAQAVVIKRDDLPGGEGLVAYLIAESGHAVPDRADLRDYLEERLPASYIPAYYSTLGEFPLTPNRKIDRKRLPAPAVGAAVGEGQRVAPKTPTETKLWEIFAENFKTEEIGTTENFFEMGGDSLMALRIVVQVSDAFHRDVPVDAFLRHPTIGQLARFLEAAEERDESRDALVAGAAEVSIDDLDHIEVAFADEEAPPQVDAVALTYIPEALAALAGVSHDEIAERWFAGKPRLTNVYHLPQGEIGVVMLPCFELDFYKNPEAIKQPVLDALALAAKMGAKTVSLTGVIPSATQNGREIADWASAAGIKGDGPVLTTGDATRSATIVRSVEGILAKSGRKIENEVLAAVGLGSIGHGTLRLMLEVMPHPRKIILCDPYQHDEELARIRDDVRAAKFMGEIAIVANGGALPPEVYSASLVVAATSLPGILDIDALQPGALVVDYSFPPVFRVADAIRRASEKGDVLFTTGGELSLGETVGETIYLPENAEEMAGSGGIEGGFLRFLAGRDPVEITGCVLVSLLTGRKETVKPTLGPLTVEDALAHYRYLNELGIGAARLQMHGYFLPEEAIEKVKGRGRKSEVS
ncbi:MAG: amino acid adenylation domain-containing protein [Verrucomicrobiae bacterium]|nr:amino acid adenylation domain-containing protein [Verrucomicrobiae bacterium]